jgi:hypothetical protein
MNRTLSASGLGLVALTAFPMSVGSAQAVVYCTTTGYPQGCIVRPVAPVARAAAIYGVGARGIGVRPGTVMNRGGPVNRVGRR